MKVQTKKTYMMKAAEVKRAWHVIDVKDRVLGQVATEIATLLMGKNSPMYTPNVDSGHYVIVTNAANVVVTGNKGMRKTYNKHSLFPGGIRQSSFDEMQAVTPEKIIERAVYNMLPSNRLRKDRMGRLKIYIGSEHPHQSEMTK
jgi:large subunit ribosomal protein L13